MNQDCYFKKYFPASENFIILKEYEKDSGKWIPFEIRESIKYALKDKEDGERIIEECFKIIEGKDGKIYYRPQDKVGVFPFRCNCNKVHLVIVLPKVVKDKDVLSGLRMVSDMAYYAIKYKKDVEWCRFFFDSPVGYTGTISGEYDLRFFLFFSYIHSLKELVEKDFRRYYINFEEILKGKLKGKIKLSSYLNKWVSGKRLDIPCRWNEFTYDNFDNRILKYALSYLKNYSTEGLLFNLITNISKGTGFFIKSHFDEVSDLLPYEVDFSKVKLKPVSRYYRKSLNIAELIVKNPRTLRNFIHSLKPMYIDMDRLFEGFVSAIAKEAFKERAEFQKGKRLFKNEKEYGPMYRPDIKIKNGENSLIIDAKYKELLENEIGKKEIEEEIKKESPKILNMDVYQIYFYLEAEGCKKGVIVFPFWKENEETIYRSEKFIFNIPSSYRDKELYLIGLNLSKNIKDVFNEGINKLRQLLD